MSISDFSVHNVLRTYSKQYRIGKLVSGAKKSYSSTEKSDAVEISAETRKVLFIKNISNDVHVELEGKVSIEDVEKSVKQELDPFIDELVKEFSPDDKDVIAIIKDKMLELF
ncbi:DVU0524 family FlgM-associated protein [Thermodesulfobacteriota bacterium]